MIYVYISSSIVRHINRDESIISCPWGSNMHLSLHIINTGYLYCKVYSSKHILSDENAFDIITNKRFSLINFVGEYDGNYILLDLSENIKNPIYNNFICRSVDHVDHENYIRIISK